ncbi:DMT family transporter [Lentzea sp. NPDC051838]|uniref:DMT family transporter n=1 Tax=Lentzea sp. NPDC051838 TaxID=3154849 RepID=UPI003421DAE2
MAGAAALAVIAVATRQPLPRNPVVWAHSAVVAVLLCVVPFLLFGWAEQHVDSALAGIYNATTPLMTTLVALAALPGERLTRAGLTGLAVGFAGVIVVLAPWQGLSGAIAAQVACLLATLCYGLSFVHLRRFVSPLGLPAVAAWGATRASTVTYLTPIVGVALGIVVLGEELSWHEPAGAVVVLLGMALVQAPSRRATAPASGAPGPSPRPAPAS